jgi:predicted nucleic acid-binding protein
LDGAKDGIAPLQSSPSGAAASSSESKNTSRPYPLRSADALELASAIEMSLEAGTVEFMTLDERLGDAAWREGLLLPLQ